MRERLRAKLEANAERVMGNEFERRKPKIPSAPRDDGYGNSEPIKVRLRPKFLAMIEERARRHNILPYKLVEEIVEIYLLDH